MKYKGVYQRNTQDCGVAALLTIIKYYGGSNTFENLRYLTKCSTKGITALNLVNTADKLGFKSRGVKCDYNDLFKLNKPLICHVILKNGYNHYIVLYKVNEKYVVVFDPYLGIKKYEKNEFLEIWSNVAIELVLNKKLDYIKENNYNFVINIIKNNKHLYYIIALLSTFSIILTITTNYYFKALLDYNNTFNIFILFTFIILIKEINDLFRNNNIIKLENNILNELNINTHNNLLSLPYYYFNNRTKGDIITKFNDLEYIKELLIKFPINIFINIILLIISSIILYIINSNLFIIFILVVFIYLIIHIFYNKKIKKLIEINQEYTSLKNTVLLENINNINTIKNINIKNLRNNIFKNKYTNLKLNNIKYQRLYIKINLIKNILLFTLINLILFIGTKMINNNLLTISELILFNSLIIYFIEPLKELCELSTVTKNGINSIKRVSEIYNIKYNTKPLINNILPITFNNLTFSFDGYNNIFSNFNYKINPNEKIMVVGKSGSGKSTLFKLLAKIYEVNDNMIKIGECDINQISIDNKILYVNDDKLFNDTLYNNIVLDKNDELLENIIDITGVKDILNKKNININSYINEDAYNFSKGERQKIILSRVLLRNSKVLILDEALSGVDEDEEYIIMNKILNKFKDTIIIYISHSKVCKNLFDKILNLDEKEEI